MNEGTEGFHPVDRYNDRAHFYTPQYPLRSEHDTRDPYDSVPIPAQQSWDSAVPDATLRRRDLEEELARTLPTASRPTPSSAPADEPLRRSDRRRMQRKPPFRIGGHPITQVTVLFAAIAVCAACLLGWSITYTYGQLTTIAQLVLPEQLAQWWPLTVYGPWFVAALSILRATVQRQPATRSWGVLLVTSAMAVALCVSHSSRSLLAFVTLGIPPITALVCFWELVGQIASKHQTRKGAHAQRSSKI
ncbi:DUF2637 domain-containing protein [Streptomyces sp. P17]|uniref:DUF2637 domain-containing protein n=1 Tax=Streptomyces sp. P17 TaxID=3074716 RepID=UPI0028F427AE|nr:DUF2637 domain-containing protein [Streptomyces sp. P17]MDT9695291.1 DUF2637 domain-containing protein [Streptomyces sp. P17]